MKERIVILVHGFMVHDTHDFCNFKEFIDAHPVENTTFELFKLYNREERNTSKPKNMAESLDKRVKECIKENKEIILVGYSFSCSIVAYVAQQNNLSGVIYIAPTVRLLKTKLLSTHLKNAWKSVKLRLKHGKTKANRIMEKTQIKGIIPLSYHISLSIVKYRKYFKSKTPFLLMRGVEDLFCLKEDVSYIAKKSSALYTKCITIDKEGWNHFFILQIERFQYQPYVEILNFLERTAR